MSVRIEGTRAAADAARATLRRRVVARADPELVALLLTATADVERRRRPLLRFVATVAELGEAAGARSYDAALLDLTGPSGKGLEAVKAARLAAPQLPLIVVVPEAEEDLARAALRLGAQDYLSPPEVGPRSLERSLRHAGERYALQRALQGERAHLAASRASMVGLIEGNADGLVVLDRSGVARFANPAAEALFGRSERELVGQSLGLAPASDGGSEIELLSRDGRTRIAEIRIAPVSWDGEPAFLASLRDVTERKRVERARQRSAESFRALAEAAPDPIVVHAGDAMLWSNRAFAQLLGVESPEAGRGGSVSAWLELPDERDVGAAAGELSDEPVTATLRTRRDVAVPVEIRRYRILFNGVDATLSLVRDLAAREQKARARAQHERLASLGRLAANLGHEINNPLSYVVSNLSYLGAHLADLGDRVASEAAASALSTEIEEARSAAADALEGAERVAAIVRDVRVLSRIESRELTTLRISDVLQSALRIARGKLAEVAHVSLALQDVPSVRANDTALLQVFVNLLVNAADACTELPSERHEVSIGCFTDAEGRAVVEIRDTGPGISDAIREHLFEPFFTTKAAGSGFGLAISFAIVESLAGTLTLESDGLRGALARVVLPPAPQVDTAPTLRRVRGAGVARTRRSGGRRAVASASARHS